MTKAKESEREFLCDFDGFQTYKGDIVEVRKPMTYADEPTKIGRVCSLIKDLKVMWPAEDDKPVLLVAGFDTSYIVIHPDGMVNNFGRDYIDGYDGCLSDGELIEFEGWLKREGRNG